MSGTKTDTTVAATPLTAFADLMDVEILEFPCVDRKGRKYGVETADQLIATSAAFADRIKPPLVLGHNEADTGQITTGMPALGWGGTLRKKMVGASVRLVTNLSQVPAAIADLIGKGAYKRISGAFWTDGADAGIPEAKGKPVLRHIGLLGADTPRIKTLADVQALYTPATPPAAAFADTDAADVAEFSMDAAPAAQEPPVSLQAAVEAEGDAETMRPLFSGVQARVWALQEEGRKGKTVAEILAGLETLGAELQTICGKMREMPGAPPAVAAAAMADENRGTGNGEPGTGKQTPGMPGDDTKTAGAPAKGAGSPAAAAPVPAAAVPAAAPVAAVTAGTGNREPGTGNPNPESRIPNPAVEMSDSAKQTVEVFLTRKTAKGQLLPKHHDALRAQAKAVFAHGGEPAVASFCDDQDALRQATVIDLGEKGTAAPVPGSRIPNPAVASAEFADADPGLVAEAEAEYERHNVKASMGITKEQYVKARVGR